MDADSDETDEFNPLTEDQLKQMSRNIKNILHPSEGLGSVHDGIKDLKSTFERVFYTASRTNLKATHQVAAWNTLCTFIEQCSNSSNDQLRTYLWNHDAWDRSLALYLDRSLHARPKSSKQLLATLGSTLRKTDHTESVNPSISRRLVEGILSDNDRRPSKACLLALAHFLRKDVLKLNAILEYLPESSSEALENDAQAKIQQLLSTLFKCSAIGDFGSVVGQVISVVLDKAQAPEVQSDSLSEALWIVPLNSAIRLNGVDIDELRAHVLPILFKRSISGYIDFLHTHNLDQLVSASVERSLGTASDARLDNEILHAALQTGKGLGLVCETDDMKLSQTSTSILFPLRCVDRMICNRSPSARLAGLSLLITSHAATTPFPRTTFRILKRRLALFVGNTDANFRSEVFSLMQKIMDRLRAITAVLARRQGVDTAATSTLYEHWRFSIWLLRLLSWELRSTSSYQRHISALKTLSIVVKSGIDDAVPVGQLSKSAHGEAKWPFHVQIMKSGLRRQLLDLLMDPFDDVRQTSSLILSTYTRGAREEKIVREEIAATIDRAESTLLATGRADHADGVAHLHALLARHSEDTSDLPMVIRLLEHLEHMLGVAKDSLATAATKYPIHGLLTSLRYILVQHAGGLDSDDLSARISTCLHRVWEIVKPILCNDAPEGYIPDELEETPELFAKDTLSYCWRALKESSLLLSVIVSNKQVAPSEVLNLSNLCFTQLAELRHRGAFSTVAQTWITCCTQCSDMESADGQMVLQNWYDKVLRGLVDRTTINTRRSAGLPSLLCGILIADKTGEVVSTAFKDLSAIAYKPVESGTAQESSLPQVHALNCIKDILKSTRLGESTEILVPNALVLAAASLRSGAWAIRNCGLMLFRAVIDRLFGTSESHSDHEASYTHKLPFKQHPEILSVVLDLLHSTSQNTLHASGGTEAVFPALQLLQQIEIPESRSREAKEAVLSLSANRSWHVRDRAARTYAAIVSKDITESEIQQLISHDGCDFNKVHGALLCIKHLVPRLDLRQPKPAKLLGKGVNPINSGPRTCCSHTWLSVIKAAPKLYTESSHPVLQASVIETLLEISKSTAHHDCGLCQEEVQMAFNRRFIVQKFESALNQSHFNSKATLRRSLAQALGYELCIKHGVEDGTGEQVASLIQALGRLDADACCAMFESIRDLAMPNPVHLAYTDNPLFLACSDVLRGSYDVRLKCAVQRFLLYLADQAMISSGGDALLRTIRNTCFTASQPISEAANQLYADQWLQLQALIIESQAVSNNSYGSLSQDAIDFVYSCTSAIRSEDVALFSGDAAALALKKLNVAFDYLRTENQSCFCDLCLAVYDLLNDDDEDIRLLASETTSRLLRTMGFSCIDLEPSVASERLISAMIKTPRTQSNFAEQAFERAFGLSETTYGLSVAESLKTYNTLDSALFAEEKQNLYVDEAREVKAWSQVVFALSASSDTRRMLRSLAPWVSEGLDELLIKMQAEVDGALGWTTKPDVFRLGLKIVYGVEAVLKAAEKGVKVAIRPSILRYKLGRLSAAARSPKVNPLWAREIDRVLRWAINIQLAHTWKVVDEVAGAITQ